MSGAWGKAASGTSNSRPVQASVPQQAHQSTGSLSKIRQLQRPTSISNISPLQSPSVSETIHPLRSTWVIFFLHRPPGQKISNFDTAMRRIGAFSSLEDFFGIYCHLRPISELPVISDYHLFRAGVKPTYEDPANVHGGKWQIRLKKGLSARVWETLVLAIIGDQFSEIGDELCGAVMSSRAQEDVLSVWNKTASNGSTNLKIRNAIKAVLNLGEVNMEYISHNERQAQTAASSSSSTNAPASNLPHSSSSSSAPSRNRPM